MSEESTSPLSHAVYTGLVDRELLESRGIEPEYIDIWGRTHVASDEVAAAILKALGEPSIAAQTIVVRETAESVPVEIPGEKSGASIKLEIEWESGELEHHWFWLPELRTIESREGVIVKRVPLPKLRPGYHRARFYWMHEPELERFFDSRFIVCPERCLVPDRRMAGVAFSLYGLRSSRNWGIGDFTDLIEAIDLFAASGAQFIALNPLHAIPNRAPYNTSPYLPECSFYRNFIYLDVEKVAPCHLSGSGVESLRHAELVDYEQVARFKLKILALLYQNFVRDGGSPEFDRYVEAEGELLHLYAVYCALWDHIHDQNQDVWLWTEWPEQYRDPASESVAAYARENVEAVQFFKFVQWHVDRQLAEAQAHAKARGMSIGLYHDLALATDRFGADLWAFRDFYVSGARVGAPPDDFSPSGQDWSFPPPNRDTHRADGYELFAQSIRKNARHGGALRIDHVMRFFRLYWIPEGFDARNGAYVRDYVDDLLGILALESVRGNFIVIGEDLGTVAPDVRHQLAQNGILSYRLLWFEKHGDGSFKLPQEYPENAAVSTTTHDLPTLAGFALARDIEARQQAGMIDDAEYYRQREHRNGEIARLNEALDRAGFAGDPLGFLLATPSLIAIVNQEDLTGELDQQNLPGTTWQYPNWRRKMKLSLDELVPWVESLREKIIFSKR